MAVGRGVVVIRGLAVAVVIVATLSGCVQRLPTYPWSDSRAALDIMAARADSIRTVSSGCTLHIKRRDGFRVSLDGAMAARIPGWLRLRAWKFGDPVLDVTVTPDGVWSLPRKGEVPPPGQDRLTEVWMLFTGRFFDDPSAVVIDEGGPRFTVERAIGDQGAMIRCEVDRATLTVRSYAIRDEAGATRLLLTLDRYRLVDEAPWPMRLTADIAPRSDGAPSGPDDIARITVSFEDPELNTEPAPGAFTPPRRAVKRP
jgi:hypothetical protein